MDYSNLLNRSNLKNARLNSGLSTSYVSKKITSKDVDVVSQWEDGKTVPTWNQLENIAALYQVPFLLFFSEQEIPQHKVIPDYRVGHNIDDSVGVNKLVNLVIRRQHWVEERLKQEGFEKVKLQGSGRNINSPEKLAAHIAKSLNIDLGYIKNENRADAKKRVLEYLISLAERHGIFVGKTISSHNIEVDDMRGMFISNDYAPFIIINRKDARSAQIFSFIHELAHFFRRSDAISNNPDFRDPKGRLAPEEVFCNRVAAELLLPSADLQKNISSYDDIVAISEIYKTSVLATFYRLKELGRIRYVDSAEFEKRAVNETKENLKLKKLEVRKGGSHDNNMRDSNGGLLNRLVSGAYLNNEIGYTEASNILKFSVEKV